MGILVILVTILGVGSLVMSLALSTMIPFAMWCGAVVLGVIYAEHRDL